MGIKKSVLVFLLFVMCIGNVCFAKAENTDFQYSIDVNLTNNQVMVYKKTKTDSIQYRIKLLSALLAKEHRKESFTPAINMSGERFLVMYMASMLQE